MGSGFLPQISFKRLILGGATRNRTGDEGFADLCLTAWLWRRAIIKNEHGRCSFSMFGLERNTGLEPATSTLARSRSTR